MPSIQTMPTGASISSYLAGLEPVSRRHDCERLCELMGRVTGCQAQMWGASIVGFGRYTYRYANGKQGLGCVLGFSARKGDISVYCSSGFMGLGVWLDRLGKPKTSKVCLYLPSLVGIDLDALEGLLSASMLLLSEQYPCTFEGAA